MTMFQSGRWALIAASAMAILAASPAQASLGFQPISQDELKMTSEPQAPGAPAIILFRQVDRDDNMYTPHEDVPHKTHKTCSTRCRNWCS